MGVNDREGVAVACTDGGVGQERGAELGSAPTVEKLLKVEPVQVRWSGGSFLCACTCKQSKAKQSKWKHSRQTANFKEKS